MRKLFAVVSSALLAVGIGLSAPSEKANAFGYNAGGAGWQNHTVTWCFDPGYAFTYESMRTTVRNGINNLNGRSGLTLSEVTCSAYVRPDIYVEYKGMGTGAATAMTLAPLVVNGYISRYGYIIFNKDRGGEVYWYGSVQQCTGGWPANGYPKCKNDAWTMSMHEMGHALGLWHNIIPDERYVCWGGYFSTDVYTACFDVNQQNLTAYKIDPMFWSAADGYRRPITSDMIAGLRSLYGL